MKEGEPPNLYIDFAVGAVQRLHGEGAIAISFEHVSGRQFAFALTEQESSALVVRVLSALHTDDEAPQTKPTIRLQRRKREISSLEIEAFGVSVSGNEARLLLETSNGLKVPFVFPASDLRTLKELIDKAENDKR